MKVSLKLRFAVGFIMLTAALVALYKGQFAVAFAIYFISSFVDLFFKEK